MFSTSSCALSLNIKQITPLSLAVACGMLHSMKLLIANNGLETFNVVCTRFSAAFETGNLHLTSTVPFNCVSDDCVSPKRLSAGAWPREVEGHLERFCPSSLPFLFFV